jgi:DNA-binding MarR family transcriptional regulator
MSVEPLQPKGAPAAADTACLRGLGDARAQAWLGLLRTHATVTKAIDADLIAQVGLSLSAYEVLTRVAHAEDGHLRISDLAQAALLSQSRVSRLVDQLERDGLVVRKACPADSRVVRVKITRAGREVARRGHELHLRGVRERFFDALDDEQVEQLAAAFCAVLSARR